MNRTIHIDKLEALLTQIDPDLTSDRVKSVHIDGKGIRATIHYLDDQGQRVVNHQTHEILTETRHYAYEHPETETTCCSTTPVYVREQMERVAKANRGDFDWGKITKHGEGRQA